MNIQREYWQYISPIYLEILNGRFSRNCRDVDRFIRSTKLALENISDEELIQIYNGNNWRELITASFLCGIRRSDKYTASIKKHLMPSMTWYAGQFHCFALARFGNSDSIEILCSYLDRYLPIEDCFYDQLWAIGALTWLDRKNHTNSAEKYLTNPLLWQGNYRGSESIKTLDPERGIIALNGVMLFVEQHLDKLISRT